MGYCQAWNCKNKPADKCGKSFFQFPKSDTERERLQRWLHNVGTGFTVDNFVWNTNKKVCSDHFHPNCFEENRMAKILGYETKPALKLKPGAIPTIFSHKTYDSINMDGETMPPELSVTSAKRSKLVEHEQVRCNPGFDVILVFYAKRIYKKLVKKAKTYEFVDHLMKDIITMKQSGVKIRAKAVKNPNIPKNIAPTPRPDKDSIMKKHDALVRF